MPGIMMSNRGVKDPLNQMGDRGGAVVRDRDLMVAVPEDGREGTGEVLFVFGVLGGIAGGGVGGAQMGGSSAASEIEAWVAQNFEAQSVGGATVYDLSS